jgi:hypothetical protein
LSGSTSGPTWLEIGCVHADPAHEAAAQLRPDLPDDEKGIALTAELQAGLVSVTAFAFAVNGFYDTLRNELGPHPDQEKWRTSQPPTPRYKQVSETLRYHLKFGPNFTRQNAMIIKELFKFPTRAGRAPSALGTRAAEGQPPRPRSSYSHRAPGMTTCSPGSPAAIPGRALPPRRSSPPALPAIRARSPRWQTGSATIPTRWSVSSSPAGCSPDWQRQPGVISPLETATAGDQDTGVRWAARYALSLAPTSPATERAGGGCG